MDRVCRVGDVRVGREEPLAIIAGPCVLESLELGMGIASRLADACRSLGVSYIFKASFDKANRSSLTSPRGPGLERGLSWIAEIGRAAGVPTTTDIHDPSQAKPVAEVVDLIQIPAFLCRQTDLLMAAGAAAGARGRAVNVKKGQFLSPEEMLGPVRKVMEGGCGEIMVTERGTFFGYHRLVNDFIGLGDLLALKRSGGRGVAVCFDCTHSTQQPGTGEQTGGRPERAPLLARAAVAAGVDAVFLECHPEPARALSDSSTMLRLEDVPGLLSELAAIRRSAPART